MKDGYIKTAAITPDTKVADTIYNTEQICKKIIECSVNGAKILVFPELCITGYSCGDLFLQDLLLDKAMEGLIKIAATTKEMDAIVFVGLPVRYRGKLYNAAAAVSRGEVLGIVPKTYLPNYNELYELRHFSRGMEDTVEIEIGGEIVPMGTKQLFVCASVPELVIAIEICEDLWAPDPPGTMHALSGATVLVNLSASDEAIGKDAYRRELVCGQSARLLCGYKIGRAHV